MSTPSYLDSPRFFDDEPLSAWFFKNRSEERSFVASRSSVQAKRLAYSTASRIPRRPPDNPADPIVVEIVKGANGPFDDTWTVLVDGIQCRQLPRYFQNENQVFRCTLPPGVDPQTQNQSNNTRIRKDSCVRPVVFGVRLEAEARSPSKVTIEVQQVLTTNERIKKHDDEDDVQVIETLDLKPYRVSDLESNSVSFMYPFCAPAPNILGILETEPLKQHIQDLNYAASWNAIAKVATSASKVAYEKYSMQIAPQTKLDYFAESNNTTLVRKVTDDLIKPKEFRLTNIPKAPTEDSTTTYRIGSGSTSCARELGELFEVLNNRHDRAQALILHSGEDILDIRLRIKTMEVDLIGNKETKALALLRSLCTCKIGTSLLEANAKETGTNIMH